MSHKPSQYSPDTPRPQNAPDIPLYPITFRSPLMLPYCPCDPIAGGWEIRTPLPPLLMSHKPPQCCPNTPRPHNAPNISLRPLPPDPPPPICSHNPPMAPLSAALTPRCTPDPPSSQWWQPLMFWGGGRGSPLPAPSPPLPPHPKISANFISFCAPIPKVFDREIMSEMGALGLLGPTIQGEGGGCGGGVKGVLGRWGGGGEGKF